MQITFNDLYARYTRGQIERMEFEGMVFKIIKSEQRRIVSNGMKPEDSDDFISWLYPRIHTAIDSYRDTGASFGAYMGTIIRLSIKEYRMRNTGNSITEYAAWTIRAAEQYAHQEGPEYLEEECSDQRAGFKDVLQEKVSCRAKNPKQLLILILKCYCYVSDDFLDRVAPRVGIPKEKLKGMIDKLRSIRAARDEELRDMRERVYSQYYRCIVYEKKLSLMQENSTAAVRMKQRIEKARCRLVTMRKRLAGIRCDASNSQIAKIIGLTKGAVDSSLHSLKTRWNTRPDKFMLN